MAWARGPRPAAVGLQGPSSSRGLKSSSGLFAHPRACVSGALRVHAPSWASIWCHVPAQALAFAFLCLSSDGDENLTCLCIRKTPSFPCTVGSSFHWVGHSRLAGVFLPSLTYVSRRPQARGGPTIRAVVDSPGSFLLVWRFDCSEH